MATAEERRALVFSTGPAAAAEAYLCHYLQPLLEALTGELARLQPDRPAAFAKSFCAGAAYEGEMRGEERFDEASAASYMTVLGGPFVAEVLAALLALPAAARPPTRSQLDAWVAANADVLGAKVDAASVKISSSLRGVAARKRVSRMRADPELAARSKAAAASAAYEKGGVSGKQAKRQPAPLIFSGHSHHHHHAHDARTRPEGPAGGADDTNESLVGRGIEQQVQVKEEEFEKYLQEQAAAAQRIQNVGRSRIAKQRLEAAKADPNAAERAAKAKESDAYSGGLTGKQKARKAREEAAAAAAAAGGEAAPLLEAEAEAETEAAPEAAREAESARNTVAAREIEAAIEAGSAPEADLASLTSSSSSSSSAAAAAGMTHEQAAKKIESVGRGMVARKKVAAMKGDAAAQERANKNKANEAYLGGLTGKQRRRIEASAAAAAAAEQLGVSEDAFGSVAAEAEAGDAGDAALVAAPGDNILAALLDPEVEERAEAMRLARHAAAKKIEAAGRGRVAREKVAALKADPEAAERAAKAKASDAYGGGMTGKQKARLAREEAAAAAAAAAGEGKEAQ